MCDSPALVGRGWGWGSEFGARLEHNRTTPTPPASLRSAVDPPHKGEGNRRHARYPRSTPPVRLPTSATIFAAIASISSSVIVFSRGCKVTAIAIDFLPGSMFAPS